MHVIQIFPELDLAFVKVREKYRYSLKTHDLAWERVLIISFSPGNSGIVTFTVLWTLSMNL